MANSLLVLTFATPTTAIGSTVAANHPASNVLVAAKWRRTFRTTTSTNGQTLDLDLGATTALTAIYLNGANFTGVQFSASATQGAGTNLYSATQTIPADARVSNRRKGIFLSAGAAAGTEGSGLGAWAAAFNHRWLRITMSNVLASAAYFELGAVVLVPTTAVMVNNWRAPYRWTPLEPFEELPYPSTGGGEGNIAGPKRWSAELDWVPTSAAAKSQVHSLNTLGIGAPFLMYENRGDVSAAYLLKRRQNPAFSETFRFVETGPWVLEECI